MLRELFAPGVGAGFTLCRMPAGANDVSRDWYSYDEVDGDFALEHFTIANDLDRHYAMAMPSPWQRGVENGLRPDQVGREGADMFVLEERYLRSYASCFGRFVDEYRKRGVSVYFGTMERAREEGSVAGAGLRTRSSP